MKPQTQRTSEEMLGQEPTTPVIVKMGGNGQVTFLSEEMPFVSDKDPWREAESTLAGRISSLEFDDGSPDLLTNSLRPGELASLEVSSRADERVFEVSEKIVDGSIRLKVSSNFDFGITEGTTSGWTESKAKTPFMDNDVKIVFRQTNTTTRENKMHLEYTFSSAVPSFTIYFQRTSS